MLVFNFNKHIRFLELGSLGLGEVGDGQDYYVLK